MDYYRETIYREQFAEGTTSDNWRALFARCVLIRVVAESGEACMSS
jgi:hypothetical protein